MKTAKAFALSFGVVLVLGASALAETFTWKGGSGRWSDAANWKVGSADATRAPGCDANITDDTAYFNLADADVDVDVDVTLYRFDSPWGGSSDEPHVVRFSGGHKITLLGNENSANVRAVFRKGLDVHFGDVQVDCYFLDLNGVGHFESGSDIVIRNTLSAHESGAKIYFEDGCKIQANKIDTQSGGGAAVVFNGGEITGLPEAAYGTLQANAADSEIVVNGGFVKLRPSATDGAKFRLHGGLVWDVTGWDFKGLTAEKFEFTGGILRFKNKVVPWTLLGGPDSVLDTLSTTTPIALSETADGVVDMPGTLCITNCSGNQAWKFSADTAITGRGKFYGSGVFCDSSVTVNWDLDTFALGGGIYQGTSSRIDFADDLTIGAYGNWATSDYYSFLGVGGKVKVDTLNCFDKTRTHTIKITRLSPRHGTSLEVCGGGTFEYKQAEDVPVVYREVVVREGTTLRLFGPLAAIKLTLEANAKLELVAYDGKFKAYVEAESFDLDETASISATLPDGAKEIAYPLVSRPDGGDVSAVAAKIAFDNNGQTAYAVHVAGNTAFVWNGTNPDRTFTPGSNQYLWTGESTANDKWFTAENWYNASVPGNSANAVCYIGGMTRQTINWNWYTGYRTSRWNFLPTCGPMTISDGPVNTIAYSDYNVNPNWVSWSRFPVVFKNGLKTSGRISIASSNSYVTVLGPVTPASGSGLYIGGDVRFGGTVTASGEFNFFAGMSGGRETRLEVLSGGAMSVAANKSLYTVRASIVVDEGGALTYAAGDGNVYGWQLQSWIEDRVHVVDGEMNVMCPLGGITRQRYRGTGTLHVESTQPPATGSCEINIGGGLTFTSGGFQTVTSSGCMQLTVSGEATLAADQPWTYGPAAGVATAATVEARALTINDHATLTIDTPTDAITFEDPIRGKGTLKFAEGAKLALGDNLPKFGKWTEIATVGAVEGEPVLGDDASKFKQVANADGTVTFLAKPATGMTLLVR